MTLKRIAIKLCELKGLDPYEQIVERNSNNDDEMHFDCLETTTRWATFIPKIKEYCQIVEAIEAIRKEDFRYMRAQV